MKNYIIVYSDAFHISVTKASLAPEQHERMLSFRVKAKQRGDSLMILEDAFPVMDGKEAIAVAQRWNAAAALAGK